MQATLSEAKTTAPLLKARVAEPSIADQVRAVLAFPDNQFDYARAKLAFDKIVDPNVDVPGTLAELDRMAEAARKLAGPNADEDARLTALRTLIYKSGPWNSYRPYAYDHKNFTDIRIKLLPVYMAERLGNCVSMPALFLILAERLGLKVALGLAPQHLFVRHHRADGTITNLETTSGANPARDEWLRRTRPMSDLSVETGLYLRSLSRREGVAALAAIILENLRETNRLDETVLVSEAILEHCPRDAIALANQGQAFAEIIGVEFDARYPSAYVIPIPYLARYRYLLTRNLLAFNAAHALGWQGIGSKIPSR